MGVPGLAIFVLAPVSVLPTLLMVLFVASVTDFINATVVLLQFEQLLSLLLLPAL